MRHLTINSGSSSLKVTVIDSVENPYLDPPEPIWSKSFSLKSDEEFVAAINSLPNELPDNIQHIVHRVVHGGESLSSTTKITQVVKDEVRRLSQFAPLHNPRDLMLIEACEKIFTQPQYAAFDTAFFSSLPIEAITYALPRAIRGKGIKRYGFHGLSHSYSLKRVTALTRKIPEKLLVFHLGSGCSLSAIKAGKPIYTTMGFTPFEGVVMGTRSGTIDPGIMLYLSREMSPEKLEQVISKESGLLGLSEKTSDMRELLLLIESGDKNAQLAYDVFIHSLIKHAGECFALMGGVTEVVFTGGIGEHSENVRKDLLSRCKFLPAKFESADLEDSPPNSFVVAAREDLEMVAFDSE